MYSYIQSKKEINKSKIVLKVKLVKLIIKFSKVLNDNNIVVLQKFHHLLFEF